MATKMNVRANSSTRLRAVALDKNGCAARTKITWRTTHGRIAPGPRLVLKKVAPDTVVTVTGTADTAEFKFTLQVSETRNLSGLAPAHSVYAENDSGQTHGTQLEHVRVEMTVEAGSESERSPPWAVLIASFLALALGIICVWFAQRLRSHTQKEELDELL